MTKIVQDTGVDKNKIYDLENDNNERDVGYKDIVALAQYYKVSLDWLLTGAGVPTANTTENYICQYTGLSESSIRFLHSNVEQSLNPPSNLLCSPSIPVSWGHGLVESVNKALKESAGARVRWPIETIEKLLSSEESMGILSDLFLFLTLDIQGSGSISIAGANDDTGHSFEELIDGDIIAWGYLKRAESKLATLRQESLKVNKIDYYI